MLINQQERDPVWTQNHSTEGVGILAGQRYANNLTDAEWAINKTPPAGPQAFLSDGRAAPICAHYERHFVDGTKPLSDGTLLPKEAFSCISPCKAISSIGGTVVCSRRIDLEL